MQTFLSEYHLPGNCTFFLHDHFDCFNNTHHEIAPHPLITDLSNWGNSIKFRFPRKPMGIRTHSCVFSHLIGIQLRKRGYVYSSNIDNFLQPKLKPYRNAWGLWELPIYYMDNMDFWMPLNWPDLNHVPFNYEVIETAIKDEFCLYVFDFHPLHIALNTRTYEDYSSVKERIFPGEVSPFEIRFQGKGVAVFFEELCTAMQNNGQRSYTCTEALEYFGCI